MIDPSSTESELPFEFVVQPDELPDGQRWSSYDDPGVLTGPEPPPDWVITEQAIDTELGVLKTGKEADVFLIERAAEHRSQVHAAKRYRGHDHPQFHRDSGYVEGRKLRNTRDRRAVAKGTRRGRPVGSGGVVHALRSLVGRAAGAVPDPAGRDRDRDGADHHRGRRGRAAAGPGPAGPRAAGELLGTAAPGTADPGRAATGPRRPVAVQHPGHRGAPGDHRPAPGDRHRRQPTGRGVPGPGLPQRLR